MPEKNQVNLKHKDRLFRFIFKDKKDLLSLYNAINDSNYTDENALIVNTMENVIYMSMQNDLSFLIYGMLNIYEHQSSWNPNMPLRDFLYTAEVLKGYLAEHDYDIYGSRLVPIPTPQSVVFYNGTKEEPERQTLKLSTSFQSKEKKGCMEYECLVLNINYGKNQELMEKCKPLMDYSILIEKIRCYEKRVKSIKQAVNLAIDDCIKEGVMSDFLKRNRGEVSDMILTEYDEQKHIENEKKWSFEEGERIGRKAGERLGRETGKNLVNELNQRLIEGGRMEDLKRACQETEYQKELLKEYGFNEE
ncbi:MAG: hypothetical protein MR380_01900 [Lachnospiraceae bacterium]|nr:hypothetical protein [Lachnospiraceae bacterium]